MAKHNFGVIKATFTNYLNESENLHAKEQFADFMKLMKESVSLRTIHKFYTNLEEMYIANENLAIKYIDGNINTIKTVLPSLNETNNKLQSLVEGLNIRVSPKKFELYSHIETLLEESIKLAPDANKIHTSFTFVLEHIKNNKPTITESSVGYTQIPKEFLIRKAIEKFNDRFSSLNESDKAIFKSIVSGDVVEKEKVFITLKEETVSTLKSLLKDGDIDSIRVNESVDKINKMKFNTDSYSNDVLTLATLKSDITQ